MGNGAVVVINLFLLLLHISQLHPGLCPSTISLKLVTLVVVVVAIGIEIILGIGLIEVVEVVIGIIFGESNLFLLLEHKAQLHPGLGPSILSLILDTTVVAIGIGLKLEIGLIGVVDAILGITWIIFWGSNLLFILSLKN